MATKTTCPVTRRQFLANAKPVNVRIGNQDFPANAKQFSTQSLGWNINAKTTILVDGVPCTVQIGLNLTVVGSKELPEADSTAASDHSATLQAAQAAALAS